MQSTIDRVERSTALLMPLLLACLVGVLTSCVTERGARAQERTYVAQGSGQTPLDALNGAKAAAVYQAAVELVGEPTARANRARIEAAVTGSDNPNAYVVNPTLKILSTGGDPVSYRIQIAVNLPAVSSLLSSLGIVKPAAAPSEGDTAPAATPAAATPPVPSTTTEAVSAAERARIERDLDQMTYMVTFDEGSHFDPFIVRSAITSGDSYLADKGIPYVDNSQIEALRKDQALVYEAETNKSVSVTQWIAQKLHADVYIVIDGQVSSSARDGRYYGSADLSLRIFETSTGSGMGATTYQSIQPSVSLLSTRDAVANAVSSGVYQAMGQAVEQARSSIARDLRSGIGYDLIMINTPDDRAMNAFRKNLSLRVREVRLLSWSSQETRYRVTVNGTAGDLQDAVYAAAQAVPGFSGLGLVTLRGRELTFDTGM